MKIIISIFLLFNSYVFAQNFKLEYDEIYLLPEINKKNLSEIIIKNYEEPKVHELFINQDDLCLYKRKDILGKVSGIESVGNYNVNYVVTNPIEKFVYKDLNIENRNYKVKSPLKLNERWQIHRETKLINGIEATKVTMESINNYTEIWFAKGIKSKCGPSNFVGFPGLVLEILIKPKTDNNPTTIFKMKNIELLKDDAILKPYFNKVSDKTISMSDFMKIYDEYQKNIQEMYGKGVDKD